VKGVDGYTVWSGLRVDRTWCRVDYKTIKPHKSITSTDQFCDEKGNTNKVFPSMDWKKEFDSTDDGTTVRVEISFEKEADMETIIQMASRKALLLA